MLGCNNIATTQIYVKILNEKVSKDMQKRPHTLGIDTLCGSILKTNKTIKESQYSFCILAVDKTNTEHLQTTKKRQFWSSASY